MSKKTYRFSKAKKEEFLKMLREGSRRGAACEAVDITREAFQQHYNDDPKFAQAVERAEIEASELIEDALFQAAMAGNVTAISMWLQKRYSLDTDTDTDELEQLSGPKSQDSSLSGQPGNIQHLSQPVKKIAKFLGVKNLKPKQRAFLAAYIEIGNITGAAKMAHISRTNHYEWFKENEDYNEAFTQAEEAAADRLEEEAWRRAVEGTVKPVFYKGQQVGGIREYSDTLLIFLLNGMRPEKYKKHSSHELKGGLELRGQVTHTNEHKYHIIQELIGQPDVADRIKENFRSRFGAGPGEA